MELSRVQLTMRPAEKNQAFTAKWFTGKIRTSRNVKINSAPKQSKSKKTRKIIAIVKCLIEF